MEKGQRLPKGALYYRNEAYSSNLWRFYAKNRDGFLRFIGNVVANTVAIFVRLLWNTLASIEAKLEIKKLI